MRILGISGSPRKGNSEFLLQQALEAAAAAAPGATVDSWSVRGKKLRACTACGRCTDLHGECVIRDDFQAARDLWLGADVVIYSATKHIDGQGRCLGGAVLADAAFCKDLLMPFLRHTGPALSPFNAWLLVKGLETLGLRLTHQCATAKRIAELLQGHRSVARTLYPHLPSHPQYELALKQMTAGGSVVSFELKGGKSAAFAFMDALEIIDISNNLGDSKSLITHPATTTHRSMGEEGRAKAGITDGMIRLSLGLESPVDLERDVARGLAAAAAVG